MRKLEVSLMEKNIPIEIKNGLFKEAGERIRDLFPGKKVMIVTDSNLESMYGKDLAGRLQDLHIETDLYAIPAGEGSKSHEQLLKLYTAFADFGLTRKDIVIALGGGVTGDLAGYAAATWLRGTGLIQMPTSLLAMVDSSIGGKVAVNLPIGKNLVGSFYHPQWVMIDPLLLSTLPERHFADGMAEIIKYGCIADEKLFSAMEGMKTRQSVMEKIEEIIFRCCDIKRQVVEKDEQENGLRMILNFGHTFGHAIEKIYNYERYTHGEAVAMGMVYITRLSNRLGFCDGDIPEKIRSLLLQFKLPVDFPKMDPELVQRAVMIDKKARTKDIHLVLIQMIGKVVIEKIPKDRIGGLIHENFDD